ncbi:hypothetical protein ABFX02_09G003800 [Erythranthe guttata]
MVKGLYRFTLEKYSKCKGIGEGNFFLSNCFTVGGYKWAIAIYPDGTSQDKTLGGEKYEHGHVYFDPYVTLVSESDNGVSVCMKMSLLNQSGKGSHWTVCNIDPCVISTRFSKGFPCFIDRDVLEESSLYLKDDCLKIECTLTVVTPSESDDKIRTTSAASNCDFDGDVGDDFLAMLTSGECSDVVLNVNGEKFHAHKFILSARSSVFDSMFASHVTVSDQHEVVIRDVEPLVFKVLLHFIYSDTLPENERRSLMAGYAFGASLSSTIGAKLLAAADKYDIKRLKSICESHLWRSISLGRFPEILSLAETFNATELKRLCFKYAADNYDVLAELGSFSYFQKDCPSLLNEIDDYIRIGR